MAELWGDLGFPDLPCLHNSRQFLVSSPELLALASGNFPAPALNDQAARKQMKPMTYRGIDMWFAADKSMLSIARVNDQLLVLGSPKTLQAAVDHSLDDSKNYSPLLARAAPFAQKDLWVVSVHLPDDLANRFVPLDTESGSFEGSLMVRNGLELEATMAAGSEQQAAATADSLRKAVPTWPALVRGMEVTTEDGWVMLALSASREQVLASLRAPASAPAPAPTVRVETPKHVEQVAVAPPEPPKPAPAPPAQIPVTKVAERVAERAPEKVPDKAPEKPQVIRIVGLDEGPREIVLPKPEKQNP